MGGGRHARVGRPLGLREHHRQRARAHPALRSCDWEFVWGGKVAVTLDHLPHLHELAPGIHATLGYNGRGVAMATVMGKVLADRVLGQRGASVLPESPLRPVLFHRWRRPFFELIVAWKRALDRLEGISSDPGRGANRIMRKTITGTGGMPLLQMLKDAGVEYLFTNPGSADRPLRPIAEDGDNRLVVGKHEGLVAAMADGYHRVSGKVGVVIAHVMGGSYQLAGQLFNAQVAGSSLLVIAGDWASELQDHRGLAPYPGLSQAESMRPITKEARCAYQVHTNPKAIRRGHDPRAARGDHAAHRPVYLSISAELLKREGLEAVVGEGADYRIEPPGPARAKTIEAIAASSARRGARC